MAMKITKPIPQLSEPERLEHMVCTTFTNYTWDSKGPGKAACGKAFESMEAYFEWLYSDVDPENIQEMPKCHDCLDVWFNRKPCSCGFPYSEHEPFYFREEARYRYLQTYYGLPVVGVEDYAKTTD